MCGQRVLCGGRVLYGARTGQTDWRLRCGRRQLGRGGLRCERWTARHETERRTGRWREHSRHASVWHTTGEDCKRPTHALNVAILAQTGGPGIEVKAGSRCWLSHCTLTGTGRAGLLVSTDSSAQVWDTEVSRAGWAGVEVSSRAVAHCSRLLLRDGKKGGLLCMDGGSVHLSYSTLKKHSMAGVDVRGAASRAELCKCSVSGGRGHGLYIHDRAEALLNAVSLGDHKGWGVCVETSGRVMLSGAGLVSRSSALRVCNIPWQKPPGTDTVGDITRQVPEQRSSKSSKLETVLKK